MVHKNAKDLERNDTFLMAGNHCAVTEIYEVDNPEMVKFSFLARNDVANPRGTMTVPNDMLFTTT